MSQVSSAFITPECRDNRGVIGAWNEAVERLRREYEEIVQAWGAETIRPTLNLTLSMERPEAEAEEGK